MRYLCLVSISSLASCPSVEINYVKISPAAVRVCNVSHCTKWQPREGTDDANNSGVFDMNAMGEGRWYVILAVCCQ